MEREGGFSLVEALIATTLGSVVVVLVSGVFLVQNQFYGVVSQRTGMHENARSVTEHVAAAARTVASGGVIVADSTRFVFRRPLISGVVCAHDGSATQFHFPGGLASADFSHADGYGVFDFDQQRWVYTAYEDWNDALDTSSDPAGDCAAAGADTAGIADEYVRYNQVLFDIGDPVMIYTEAEYRFASSALRPGNTALFVGHYGDVLAEYSTGLASDAHFAYRLADGTYTADVDPGDLDAVDGIRIWARAQADATSGQAPGAEFGWATDVPFRNSR